MEIYRVPARMVETEIEVINSRFIASLGPIFSAEQARSFIGQIRRSYPDASHHVPAYILGHGPSTTTHCSDDGEPSGTAGRPILGQIQQNELTDILVIVVRYFGGVLLGTSGLTNAYKQAASEALSNAMKIEKIVESVIDINFDYLAMNDLMTLIKEYELETTESKYDLSCELKVMVRKDLIPTVMEKLEKIDNLKAKIIGNN